MKKSIVDVQTILAINSFFQLSLPGHLA